MECVYCHQNVNDICNICRYVCCPECSKVVVEDDTTFEHKDPQVCLTNINNSDPQEAPLYMTKFVATYGQNYK